jgi:hypothetical protein
MAIAGFAAAWVPLPAFAGAARSKLRAVRPPGRESAMFGPGPRGSTLLFELEHAPFGAGDKYRDATVLVYVPAHYRMPASGAVDVVVHFHGHHYTAERATMGHVLREQLDDSGVNAILVVPQLAVLAVDSSAGRLERPRGLDRMLRELVRELRRSEVNARLGAASLAAARRVGTVCLSAHSGGYLAAARCLAVGGREISGCWLFDALYGETDTFADWLLGAAEHRLTSFHAGGDVTKNSLALAARFASEGVDCRQEQAAGQPGCRAIGRHGADAVDSRACSAGRLSRGDLCDGRAVFVAIPDEHAGAAFAQNQFRDCLCASRLPGERGAWLRDRHAPRRRIDRRGGG